MSREAAMAVATGTPAAAPTLTVVPDASAITEAPRELDSTRFTHLAKKEADLVKQREEFKRERELVLADKEKLKPLLEKAQRFEELKKTDPVAAMKFLEFSDTDLINFLAAQEDTSTPEEKAAKAAQAEIKKFQDSQTEKENKIIEERNKKVIERFRQDINKHVVLDKEKYEYCNFHGSMAEELIYETVAKVLEDTKEVISVQEASDLVEAYYEEQDKAMSTLKKRTPQEAIVQAKQDIPLKAEVSPRPSTPSKTLNSKVGATVASTVTRKETSSEKRERLIRKLGGN